MVGVMMPSDPFFLYLEWAETTKIQMMDPDFVSSNLPNCFFLGLNEA